MLLDNIGIALTALKSNKLRSLLTMLGIVIGISAVIAIMIVGDAVNQNIVESFNSLGANKMNFYVWEKEIEEGEDYAYRPMKNNDMVSEDMLKEINQHFAGRIDGIQLTNRMGSAEITERSKSANVEITGINAAALKGSKLDILAGRTLGAEDMSKSARTALISDKAAEKLYGSNYENIVGKPLEASINNKLFNYTVVGVYKTDRSQQYMGGFDGEDSSSLYVPLRTSFDQMNSEPLFNSFEAMAADGENQDALIADMSSFINDRYYSNNDFYEVSGHGLQSILDESTESLNKIKIAIAAIAAISLLVGGIGVMNIMIVSITERTREIGTRKALGAENSSIRMQFITEAIVICLIGGGLGILLGNGIGMVASKMLLHMTGSASLKAVLGCVLFSAAFGVFFGYYPANKAAKLNPIDALRYE